MRVYRVSATMRALSSGSKAVAASRPARMARTREVKSAVAAANNAYESVHKAAKQATEVAEANFTAMTNTAVNATKQATGKGKRAA